MSSVRGGWALSSLSLVQWQIWRPCPVLWNWGRKNYQAQCPAGPPAPTGSFSGSEPDQGEPLHASWPGQEACRRLHSKLGRGDGRRPWYHGSKSSAVATSGCSSSDPRQHPRPQVLHEDGRGSRGLQARRNTIPPYCDGDTGWGRLNEPNGVPWTSKSTSQSGPTGRKSKLT